MLRKNSPTSLKFVNSCLRLMQCFEDLHADICGDLLCRTRISSLACIFSKLSESALFQCRWGSFTFTTKGKLKSFTVGSKVMIFHGWRYFTMMYSLTLSLSLSLHFPNLHIASSSFQKSQLKETIQVMVTRNSPIPIIPPPPSPNSNS